MDSPEPLWSGVLGRLRFHGDLKVVGSQRDRAKRIDLLCIQFGRHTYTLEDFLCNGEPQFLQDDMSVCVRHGLPCMTGDLLFNFMGT